MTKQVDIFTTSRLVQRFCQGGCERKAECNPVITESGSDGSGLNYRVVGRVLVSECPIMARMWPVTGWVDAQNHTGKCGYQE